MSYLFDKPFSVLDRQAFNDLLIWAESQGASDIHIQPFTPVCAQINQKVEVISAFQPSDSEVNVLVDEVFGTHAMGVLKQGDRGLNDDYRIRIDRFSDKRFRLNATPCFIQGSDGVQITARAISHEPPTLDQISVEETIRNVVKLGQGLVLITGSMGTGKTTLLSSLVRSVLEDPDARKHIITAESPIEYVYDRIDCNGSIISPLSIPRQLKTFHAAVVEATRRRPHIFVLGEAREINTFRAVIEAAQLGILVLTTLHTNSVAETMNRIINQFHMNEQAFQKANIVDSLRMIVSQTLLPCERGGLIALREILPLHEMMVRSELMSASIYDISNVTRSLVSSHGKSMFRDAMDKYKQGLISEYHLNFIRHSFGEY